MVNQLGCAVISGITGFFALIMAGLYLRKECGVALIGGLMMAGAAAIFWRLAQ